MRVLVVVNDQAGLSDAGLYQFVRLLGLQCCEVTLRYVAPDSEIPSLVADATLFERIVVAAGDGTVSAVAYATRGTGVPILTYPSGTANLLAMNLGLPMEPPALADLLMRGPHAAIDLGELTAADIDGTPVTSGFALIAGAGYDAAIMRGAASLKPALGVAAYFVSAAGNLAPTPATFAVTVDGEELQTEGIAVLITNFGRIQFDLTLTPGADPQDGLLDVAILRGKTPVGLLPALTAAMLLDRSGEHLDRSNAIEVRCGARIEVASEPLLAMQADGDVLRSSTPFTARVLPRAATLVVPAETGLATQP